MRSLKQSEASRINGAKSRGPVTDQGKARSAANSTKHGLYAETVVLENEDPALYDQWRANYVMTWQPADDHEYQLVTDIVDARWRLRRWSVLESKAIDFEISRMRPEIEQAFVQIDEGTRTVFGLTSLITLNRTFEVLQTVMRTQHRLIERATRQLMDLRKGRGEPPAPPRRPELMHLPELASSSQVPTEIPRNEPGVQSSGPHTPEFATPVIPATAASAGNSGNEPEPSLSLRTAAPATPPNWENEPDTGLTPQAEQAMQDMLSEFLRRNFSPDALTSLANMRR